MTGEFTCGPEDITLFALSTCIWCRKTRRLLDSLGVEYRLIELDLLTGDEKVEAFTEVSKWSRTGSFPVLVIHNRKAIQGYKEDAIVREFV